jgi:regulator of replication initiation timing
MDVTEDLLYAEIGRGVVALRVLRTQLQQSVTEQRRLEQENASLKTTVAQMTEDVRESGRGVPA